MTPLEADSASLAFLLPETDPEACSGAARVPVRVGAPAVGELAFRRERSGEIRLAPGELRPLDAAEQECLLLEPVEGASYALAFVDTRAIDRARTEAEPRFGYPDLRVDDRVDYHSICVEDLAPLDGPLAGARPERAIIPDEPAPKADALLVPPRTEAGPAAFRSQSEPWEGGDGLTVTLYSSSDGYSDAPATIVRTYADRYAVPLVDRDAALRDAGWLDVLDGVMADFLAKGEPLFRASLRDGFPTTAGSGQLLMVVGASVGSFAFNEETSNWVQVGLPGHGRGISRFVVFHELAHAWQFHYMQQRIEGSPWEFTNWAMEGGANTLAREGQREVAAQSFFDNPPISEAFGGFGVSLVTFRQDEARSGQVYDFNAGYGGSEWLLRDLVARLVLEGGLPFGSALREVARGSLDGWFGHSSPAGEGLYQRMAEGLGEPWEPVDALLLALASIVLDDLGDDPRLQTPYAYRIFEHHGPAGWLIAGEGGTLTRVAGDATAAGYIRILQEGHGGSYRMGGDVPGLEWMLVRVR